MRGEVLWGHLATGIGQGRHFTRLDWARAQFMEKLGIDPYPGTVNVVLDDPDAMPVWERLKRTPGIRIDNPNDGPHDCDARCYPVSIEGRIDGAIVFPEVEGYPAAQVEIIAATSVRDALGIKDGAAVKLTIK
jgi:phosphoglycolate phosphatase